MKTVEKKKICPKCAEMMSGMLLLMKEILETLDNLGPVRRMSSTAVDDYWRDFLKYKKKIENMHK
jgi:hypothetical protein